MFFAFSLFFKLELLIKSAAKRQKKPIDLFTILQITFRLKFWLEDQRPLRPMSNCGNKEMRHFFEAECFYWVKTGPPISDFDLHYCLQLTLPTLTETRMKLKTALLSVNIGVLLTVKASGKLIKMKTIWMMEWHRMTRWQLQMSLIKDQNQKLDLI